MAATWANPDRLPVRLMLLALMASENRAAHALGDLASAAQAGTLKITQLAADGDLKPGEKGLICSFGAGYSAGTVFVEKAA